MCNLHISWEGSIDWCVWIVLQTGISGPFWYAAGATIPLLLFASLSAQMKTRAPGAKTFLQVIKARFGPRTHLVFCFFALLTNVIVTAMLMLGKSRPTTCYILKSFRCLKTVDTIGNCQRPVFSLGVSQHMHKITNLWKFELNKLVIHLVRE